MVDILDKLEPDEYTTSGSFIIECYAGVKSNLYLVRTCDRDLFFGNKQEILDKLEATIKVSKELEKEFGMEEANIYDC